MNTPGFNHPLELPGAPDVAQYKLPPILIRYPLELPNHIDNPDICEFPSDFQYNEMVLPDLGIDEEMEVSSVPKPFAETVRFIHRGITPRIINEVISLNGTATDIHHIVKRSHLKSGVATARKLLPFRGAVAETFDLLTQGEDSSSNRLGGMGHMLMNLIPLDYDFHHDFVEMRSYAHTMQIGNSKMGYITITIPQLLMGFTIFNLNHRLLELTQFIEQNIEKCEKIIRTTRDQEERCAKEFHLKAWQQMQLELLRVPYLAQEVYSANPVLYSVWKSAMGGDSIRIYSDREKEH